MEEKGKKLGLLNLVGLGLGGAIGTGIFMMLGFGIAIAGRSILLVCMVGCLYMLLAYWYNLAMANMFVFKGGDYSMRTLLFNPLMTGVNAGFNIIQVMAVSGQAVAITGFLVMAVPALEPFQTPVAFVILTLGFLSTVGGSRFVTLLQNGVTALLIIALIIFVAFGIGKVDAGAFFSNADGGFWRGGIGGLFSAIAIMAFACMGTTGMVSMAAVTENPKRKLPISILVVTIALALIYGLMAYVAAGVLPYEQIAGENISVTAQAIMPNAFYLFFLIGGGICAIGSSMLSTVAIFRYPIIQIADDGWLPPVFKKTTKKGYPWVAYGVLYIVGAVPILVGMSVDVIVSQIMIPLMLMNLYMNLACLRLPKKYPEQWAKRSLKIPVWAWNVCCVLGAVCAGLVSYNLFIALTWTDALVCVGILVFLVTFSVIRLKQKAVTPEQLNRVRDDILQQALADDNE